MPGEYSGFSPDIVDVYRECLDIALGGGNHSIWYYSVKDKTARLIIGEYQKFRIGDTMENVPDALEQGDWLHPSGRREFLNTLEAALNVRQETGGSFRVKYNGDKYKWQSFRFRPQAGTGGGVSHVLVFIKDITGLMELERQYYQDEYMLNMQSEDVIAVSRVDLSKNRVEYIWGANLDDGQANETQTYDQMFRIGYKAIVNADDRKRYQKLFGREALLQAFMDGKDSVTMECRKKNETGRIIWCSLTATLMEDPESDDIKFYSSIRDIDEKKKLELSLRERAVRDMLTGTYNKGTIESMVKESLVKYAKSGKECVFLIVYIDNLENINTAYGYSFGSYVLVEIGRVLGELFGYYAIRGRVGGAKFAVYDKEIPSRELLMDKVLKLLENLRYVSDGNSLSIDLTVSVGLTFLPHKEAGFGRLYSQAELALEEAVAAGRNQYAVFDSCMELPFPAAENRVCSGMGQAGGVCLMDELDEITVLIDMETHEIVYMNPSAKEEFARGKELGDRLKCYEVIQGYPGPCPFCPELQAEASGTWYNTNSRLRQRFMVKDKVVERDGRKYRLEMLMDAEQSGEGDKAQLSRLLLDTVQILISGENLTESVHRVLEKIGRHYGSNRTYILEKNVPGNTVSVIYEWCADGVPARIGSMQDIEMKKLPRWSEAAVKMTPITLEFLEEIQEQYPEEYEILRSRGVKSLYVIPFDVQDALEGYIGMDNPSCHMGSISFLSTISFLVGIEIARRRLHEKQYYMHYYDMMTGLMNRNSYLETLRRVRVDIFSSIGVLTADINGLKNINEENGMPFGDHVVKDISRMLVKYFGKETVFRLEGDEFVVLSLDVTRDMFEQQIDSFRQACEEAYPGVLSMGYTWADTNIDIERMVRNAEEMLLADKKKYHERNGGNTYVHGEALNELLADIADGRYVMYLQPKARIDTQRIQGAEALVRYVAKDGSIVGPGQFVPQLERCHMIRYIDLFIFEQTCKLLKQWEREGYELFPISLNFSRSTMLDSGIIEEMNRISGHYQVDRKLLEIEITESFGGVELETIKKIGNTIEENGYLLSLDDFGAMYSNISILSALRLDVLKLDKCIVDELYINGSLKTIVQNLIVSCHEIGIKCVAEGVETQEQLDILKDLDCDFAQGYLYNKPIPIDDFVKHYMDE